MWRHAHLIGTGVSALLFLQVPLVRSAPDEPQHPATKTLGQREGQRTMTKELSDTVELLEQELNQEQEALKSVQTDRERQLVQTHIEFLKKEQQSLQQLLHHLGESTPNIGETALEKQQELREERIQRQLEQDKRVPHTQ